MAFSKFFRVATVSTVISEFQENLRVTGSAGSAYIWEKQPPKMSLTGCTEHLRATASDLSTNKHILHILPPGKIPKFNKVAAIGTPATINFMVQTIGKH